MLVVPADLLWYYTKAIFGSFTGLSELETDDKMEKLEKSSEEKFILAFDSLKNILERI